MQIDQDHQQKGERGAGEEAIREYPHHSIASTQVEEKCPRDLSTETISSYYKNKSNSEKVNLEHLKKQIRNLIYTIKNC